MAYNRLYPFWNFLEEVLKRRTPQNEIRIGEQSLFEKIYADQDKTREFVNAMGGAQVVIENIIDDERREIAFGLMMPFNMLIDTSEG